MAHNISVRRRRNIFTSSKEAQQPASHTTKKAGPNQTTNTLCSPDSEAGRAHVISPVAPSDKIDDAFIQVGGSLEVVKAGGVSGLVQADVGHVRGSRVAHAVQSLDDLENQRLLSSLSICFEPNKMSGS